jgi:hypothetical protein
MLLVGFGLAFSAGLVRGGLVAAGVAAYLYGLALAIVKRHERKTTAR